jgi:hypothetical protein
MLTSSIGHTDRDIGDIFLSVLLRGARPTYIVLIRATKARSVRSLWMSNDSKGEAAQRFADAFMQSFRAVSDRTAASQEQGAQLTQEFFNMVIENLRTQAEDTGRMIHQVGDQQQRAAEAGHMLAGASVDAYMDFVNSMFTFYQCSVETAQRGTRGAGR